MAKLPVPSAPILVVGDIMCDHYVWGDVERISPEAPVQVLRWEREADRPGGAANAALNLAALGCRVQLVGVVGKDEPGRWLLRTLQEARNQHKGVIRSSEQADDGENARHGSRPAHAAHRSRNTRAAVDAEDERPLMAAIEKARRAARPASCARITTKAFCTDACFARSSKGRRKPFVAVDPKSRDFRKIPRRRLLTPNEKELADAASG